MSSLLTHPRAWSPQRWKSTRAYPPKQSCHTPTWSPWSLISSETCHWDVLLLLELSPSVRLPLKLPSQKSPLTKTIARLCGYVACWIPLLSPPSISSHCICTASQWEAATARCLTLWGHGARALLNHLPELCELCLIVTSSLLEAVWWLPPTYPPEQYSKAGGEALGLPGLFLKSTSKAWGAEGGKLFISSSNSFA